MIKFKKKGFLLIEGVLQVAVLSLLAIGCSALFSNQFSILSASKVGNQARELAEVEADYLKTLGYDDLDSGEHSQKSLKWLLGTSDLGDEYDSKVTVDDPITVSEDNEIKIAHINVYKSGEKTSRYSLEVPLSSSQGNNSSASAVIPDANHILLDKDIGTNYFVYTMPEDGYIIIDGDDFDTQFPNVLLNGGTPWYTSYDIRYQSTEVGDGDYRDIESGGSCQFYAKAGDVLKILPKFMPVRTRVSVYRLR